jgi:hypothetical protein
MIINSVVLGRHFNTFVESQKIGPKPDGSYKKRGITVNGATTLREETQHILARCNPHDATTNPETTHLVVGYVQSGKTMSFTGLTALALDNGYRIVVYLAGSKTNLLNQTSDRLTKDLIGKGGVYRDYYKLHKNPGHEDIEQIIGHINLSSHPIVLIPILKHYKHINNLTSIFKDSDFKEAMESETVLIVDDEADQVSLNSYGRKNSRKAEEEEDEKSRTYDAILKMRTTLPGNSYIQYTATPQANILISMQDLLSPKSHTLLTPGEGYIGGLLYFGRGKNHDLYHGRLIQTIPDGEVFHKKRNLLTSMPQSLRDALMMHILAVAIIVKYLRRDGVSYLSMMVHPATEKLHNKKFKQWIDKQMRSWRKCINKPDGHDDKEDMFLRFEQLFPQAIEFFKEEDKPEFENIKPFIHDVLFDWKSYLVNTDSDADKEIGWNQYSMHILVGAEMLNRGFTVENLTTTYMPRYSQGPANADTIQQRCRFFGYKRDYIESCRVYLPSWTMADYDNYIKHEEELRTTLKSCDTLAAAERKILLSPHLRPTRQNVLPISIVNTKLRGMREMQAFESKQRIEANTSLVEVFIDRHRNDFDIKYEYNTLDRTHRGFRLSMDEAIEFLNDFQFGNYNDAVRKAATIRYLRYLSGLESDDAIKYVYFIQMAYSAPIRERDFDFENLRLASNTRLGAGPSTSGVDIYPGDSKVVGDGSNNDSITIQLHHIKLKNVPLDYAHEAYSLAINYPEQLAINYIHKESDNQEDDDIEDED